MYISQVGKGVVAESIKQIRVGFFIKEKKIHERKEYTNKQEKKASR